MLFILLLEPYFHFELFFYLFPDKNQYIENNYQKRINNTELSPQQKLILVKQNLLDKKDPRPHNMINLVDRYRTNRNKVTFDQIFDMFQKNPLDVDDYSIRNWFFENLKKLKIILLDKENEQQI